MATKRLIATVLVIAVISTIAVLMWKGLLAAREREQGLEFAAGGNFPAAEPLLKKSLERDPDDLDVIKAIATHHARANEPEQALPMLERWEQLRPDDPDPLAARFRMRVRLRQYDAAIADAERLSQLPKVDSDLPLHIADTFIRAGRLGDAERVTRAGLAGNSGEISLRLQLAEILHGRHEWTTAQEILDELVRDAPQLARAWKTYGLVLHDRGDAARAIPYFEKSLSLDETDISARYHLALALTRAGQDENAQREMTRFEKTRAALDLANLSYNQPDRIELALRAATACLDAGMNGQARLLLQQVLAIDPNHAEAKRLLSSVSAMAPK